MHSPLPMEDRTILHYLRQGVERHPEALAISDESIELTYQELWERARTIAGGLSDHGIARGDRVLTMLENSADCFVLLLATSFLGAELVPVNLAWRDAHLAHVISEADCVAAVVDPHYLDPLRVVAGDRLRVTVVRGPKRTDDAAGVVGPTWEDLLAASPVEPIEVRPDTTVAVIFTSGTTGKSKGVLTTHAQIVTMCNYSPHAPELGEKEKWYVPTPMFHALGLFGGAFAPLMFGGSSYIAPSFSPSRFWDDVRRSGATTMLVVGTMVDFVVAQPERPDDRDNTLHTVNAVPRPASAAAFRQRFGARVTTSYGSSEFGTSFADRSDEPVYRSLGVPREGVSCRLVDLEGRDVPTGEPGELLLRPEDPAVFTPGYVNNPEATAALQRDDGWFSTGDILRCDEGGRYYYVDRLKDSIRRRGENISSMEVELAIAGHDEVAECAAIGVGDPADQEVMIVVIKVPGSELTEVDLVRFVADRLPYYAVPRFIAFASDLPRTPTGKVQKAVLRGTDLAAWDREEAGITISRRSSAPAGPHQGS